MNEMGMNKMSSTVTMVLGVVLIAIVAIGASVFVLTDDRPENDGQISLIFMFAGGLAASVFVIVKILMGLQEQIDGRLTQLLEATRVAARADGVEEGKQLEQVNPSLKTIVTAQALNGTEGTTPPRVQT